MSKTKEGSSYSADNVIAKYANSVLDTLPKIDRVNNETEMEEVIMELLGLLGKCTGADRVYIFDKQKHARRHD